MAQLKTEKTGKETADWEKSALDCSAMKTEEEGQQRW
jgi:hypothetical protein